MKQIRNHTITDNKAMQENAERWQQMAETTDDKAMKAKLQLFAKLCSSIAD